MIKRRKTKNDRPYPEHWTVSTEYQVGKKVLKPGVFVSISDEPGGRFAFIRYVANTATGTEWIDCVGGTGYVVSSRTRSYVPGPNAVAMFRAFRPDRILKVFP